VEGRSGKKEWNKKENKGRKEWKEGVEGRSGRKEWKEGVEGRSGRKEWKEGRKEWDLVNSQSKKNEHRYRRDRQHPVPRQ
jgi:hypothetical protein